MFAPSFECSTIMILNVYQKLMGNNITLNLSVCQLEVDLANRSLDARSSLLVSCYLPSICTGFHCCVDVPAINMSFNAYLSVDPCNYMLTVGIENFSFNKSLDYYTFGKFPLTDITPSTTLAVYINYKLTN